MWLSNDHHFGSNAAYFRRGLVYRVALDGTTTVLHTFTGIPGDGEGYAPFGQLALGSDGNVYGMARGGNTDAFTGCGTGIIYRVTLSGEYSTVHRFALLDSISGNYPEGVVGGGSGGCEQNIGTLTSRGLVAHPDGNLYGVTRAGGVGGIPSASADGGGVFFRLTTAGEYTVLYNLAARLTPDGIGYYGNPSSLTLGSDGVFYGSAYFGGLFKVTTSGQFTPLYEFQAEDLGRNEVSPVEGDDRNFYGMIHYDGSCTVFYRITKTGIYTRLNSCVPSEYNSTGNDLTKGADGNFYWVSTNGGINLVGIVRRITPEGVVSTVCEPFPGFPVPTGPGNTLPTGNDDSYTMNEDGFLSIQAPGVLGNDTDDEPLQAGSPLSQPSHGSLSLFTNGSFTYTPTVNFNGSDSFTYEAVDQQGESETATVFITISPVNDPPLAVNDTATTKKNTSSAISVLANDSDVDNPVLQVALPSANTLRKGKITTNGTTVSYMPKNGFTGTDTFTYQVNDGILSSTATVTVTVTKP